MKNKLFRIMLAAFLIMNFAADTMADSRTFTPPAKKGTIYVVVRFKPYNSSDFYPKTKVSVKWGDFSKSKSYGTATSLKTAGVIIKLRHTKDDSVPLTVETEGTIVSINQSDSPPSEWDSANYQKDSW